MVADHPKPPQQRQPASSNEDAAIKRNTDCVYFLASPLTCKKGGECEYRHSEYARVNPRDCWYWMNGNCLNLKCSFRHPPLDGLLGTQAEAGSSVASSQPAVSANMHPPFNATKQAVPCIFFQKGMCLKADKCNFLHGPNLANAKAPPQEPAASLSADPLSFKRSLAGIAREEKISQADTTKPVEVPNMKQQTQKLETIPFKNEALAPKDAPQSTSPPVINGYSITQPDHMHRAHLSDDRSLENGNDADESFRESSPGFDVLVDDEARDPELYHEEDQTDLAQSVDYGSIMEIDRGERVQFHDLHGFDSYHPMQEQYDQELHMSSSSEGKFAGVRKRGYSKVENFDEIDTTDLRHRLSKQRRGFSGLRSAVCLDHGSPSFTEERVSLSNRLQGRIAFPHRQFPGDGNNSHLEKGLERRRSRLRSSLGKLQSSSQARRPHDRNSRGSHVRGVFDDTGSDFAGPKSLAELKGRKGAEKRVCGEDELLFEGPKPLNMILRQKTETKGDNNEGEDDGRLGVEDGLVQKNTEDLASEEFDLSSGGENEDHDMESIEEEDGEDDDFAKKIKSVMLGCE